MSLKTVTIMVDNVPVKVEAGVPFTVVTKIAHDRGLRKVVIFLNGVELDEQDDPKTIKEDDKIVVRRDDFSGA